MRLGVVSDIHGNLAALEAVADALASAGVDAIVNLGDCVSGPLLPAETARWLMHAGWPTIAGNHERQLLALRDRGVGESASDRFAAARLGADAWQWIAHLPPVLQLREGPLLCHGTPDSDLAPLAHAIEQARMVADTPVRIATRLPDIDAPVIACGHTHLPVAMRLEDGRLVVNPGSVGLQAFRETRGTPYVVEAGSPHARYAVLTRDAHGWRADLQHVAYDFESMAHLAEHHGAPDWAHALRTGLAPT